MKTKTTFLFLLLCFAASAQKEVVLSSGIEKVTMFFQGAQIQHEKKTELKPGRQILVFEKLTDFMDPNSVQVKANGDLTILSVSTRKNYEDLKMTSSEIMELNSRKKELKQKDQLLRDEYGILENDKDLLIRNSELKGEEVGLKVTELKDAYTFIHAKMLEIVDRETALKRELEGLSKEINKIEQEIATRQSKPVTNYTEILVEVEVEKATPATFSFNYISPNASWSPYYDLRSDGIGKPVRLEAKALVNQTTGIEWKDVDLVLSTNDPYENSKEPELQEWYLNYNNYPQPKNTIGRTIPVFDYSGQKLRGEVLDASTGEPLAFAKISFYGNSPVTAVTDFEGKFEVIVPKGESYVLASYAGFQPSQLYVNAPYLKFALYPEGIDLSNITLNLNSSIGSNAPMSQEMSLTPSMDLNGVYFEDSVVTYNINGMLKTDDGWTRKGTKGEEGKELLVNVTQKDLRVEYAIQSKFTIASNGQDQRVQISNYELPASYEYHAAPKLDPSVYLVAQVSGWEKLNLLNGESNLYFDGTYIGKTYVDANSTKDTLSFSLGKDNKVQVERTKISEKSKSRTIGSREKMDIGWEIKLKNNGGAMIPIFIKDQFPVSTNEDIKVKRGEFPEGKVSENSGIITWSFQLNAGQNKVLNFDYSVDYERGYVLYLE